MIYELTGIEQYVVDYVRKLRKEKHLTQEDIAHIIGTTNSFVGNCESPKHPAKYNLNHINLLADHFGLKIWDFLPKYPIIGK